MAGSRPVGHPARFWPGGDLHPFGELEPGRPLLGVVDGVHHVDRQTALVGGMRHWDALDRERRSLERAGRDDDVAFFVEDPVHPVDGRVGVAGRLRREDVAVLLLKWRAWFARGPSGRGRHWRRLQAGGRDGVEIRGAGQDALRHAPGYARLRRARGYRSGEAVGAWLRRRRPDRRRAGSPRRERRWRGPVAAGLTAARPVAEAAIATELAMFSRPRSVDGPFISPRQG